MELKELIGLMKVLVVLNIVMIFMLAVQIMALASIDASLDKRGGEKQ